MDYGALFDRILAAVDHDAYLPLADAVEPRQRAAMQEIEAALRDPDREVSAARALARRLHAEGRIDDVMLYSALHVIAASPRAQDLDTAAALVAQQELAALRLGGPNLQGNLASVDRHRGVLAFLIGEYPVAIDYFTRAFERQRSAGNLANVMATLLRLGDEDDARQLLEQVRSNLPRELTTSLDEMIAADPDLALLRDV
jgi:tetratricopeptide (TPR) repeat protein